MLRRLLGLLAFALVIALPSVAFAGALDDLVGDLIGSTPAYWAEVVALVTAVSALATALLPQGTPGSLLDKARRLLNAFAANWGNAKNLGE